MSYAKIPFTSCTRSADGWKVIQSRSVYNNQYPGKILG